ncbi:hypothetical protein JKP88DRAFT_287602 [Tribonema minus]|uniref:Uncharacterized protein n=1 Tax=Tribonema minus TaxID=303371 RepID=A0A835ZDB7_9STRA|nr:hypothetical protein JKP88DRAFT_287602 [Tribonema minus]
MTRIAGALPSKVEKFNAILCAFVQDLAATVPESSALASAQSWLTDFITRRDPAVFRDLSFMPTVLKSDELWLVFSAISDADKGKCWKYVSKLYKYGLLALEEMGRPLDMTHSEGALRLQEGVEVPSGPIVSTAFASLTEEAERMRRFHPLVAAAVADLLTVSWGTPLVQRQEAQLTQHSLALEQMAAAGDDICAVCSEPMDTAAAVPLPCELHHLHLHCWLEFVSSTDTTAYCGAGSDCNLVGGHCSGCTNSLEVYNCPTCRLFKPSVTVLREGLRFVLAHMRNMATKIKDHYRSQAHSAAVRDSAVRVAEKAQADVRVLQTAMQEQRQKLQAADVALARMAARIHGADEARRAAEGARRAAEEAQRAAEEAADAWQDSARLERAALEIERGTKRKSHALTEE